MFNEKYPAKNRQAGSRPVLAKMLRYRDQEGFVQSQEFTPNDIVHLLYRGKAVFLALARPLSGAASLVSGGPAIEYHSGDMIVSLTPEEMIRYLAHNLTPAEYFSLRDRFGDHFEIHDDFYCEESGMALQPFDVH